MGTEVPHALWVSLVGTAVVLAALIKTLFARMGIPALVGYLLLGFLLRLADLRWGLLTEPVRYAFAFLADMGVVALLFEVGLKSHPTALAQKLPQASLIWLGDITLSALFGYAGAYYVLGLPLLPSLVVATALTATSVGVSVTAWQQAINSPNGQVLIDVAELDDLSGIALMALLFSLLPVLQGSQEDFWPALGLTSGIFLLKLAFFLSFCLLFSHYLEPRFSHLARYLEPSRPQRMLLIAGLGFLIASMADWLGFSLAIGALFAGLVFSRDPVAVKTEASFQDLYSFFTPFFFIGIGIHIDPTALTQAIGFGDVFLLAAILGKVIGAGIPALLIAQPTGALLISVSMVPRAEIAMIITHQGYKMGVISNEVYAGMALVTAGTCILAPWLLRDLLRHWPQTKTSSRPTN